MIWCIIFTFIRDHFCIQYQYFYCKKRKSFFSTIYKKVKINLLFQMVFFLTLFGACSIINYLLTVRNVIKTLLVSQTAASVVYVT